MSETPTVMETVPVALSIPTVPIVRPIIGTNTYRQVCKKKNRDVPVKGLQMEMNLWLLFCLSCFSNVLSFPFRFNRLWKHELPVL